MSIGESTSNEVIFKNETGYNIFSGLNLHIKPGQKIGIVGTSGAGKTTLIKCLLRYFDVQQGQITIDGHSILDITQESLWASISLIPQDITMFHRTILENLQIAKYDASFDDIVAACKKARIHDAIMAMTNGYHSVVGERGVKISGGQRQRIAIARAILKNAPILILDEATSALDTPTERMIQESLNEVLAMSQATAIVIAHRLSTLLNMDRILVFNHGQIVEDGTHQELLAKSGLYKTLWDAQVGGFLPEKFV
jgi:ATP-binding cassette subfamily B protein